MNKTIFISYSTKDKNLAYSLVEFLENRGFSCFISSRDIPLGSDWASCIIDALEKAKLMIIIFTENYNKSVQVDREISVCCDLEKPIIPLRVSNEPLIRLKKYYLNNINWINFKQDNEDYNTLINNIQNIIQPDCKTTLEEKNILGDSLYKVYFGNEIKEEMIYQAVEIDKLVYNDSYIGDYYKCINWWKKNKFIYVMIQDIRTKKIIGYINSMPIDNILYNKIKNGEIIDVMIGEEDIETYDLPDIYNLYISSVALHPSYHNTGAFKFLYDALMKLITELFKRELHGRPHGRNYRRYCCTSTGYRIWYRFGSFPRKRHHHCYCSRIYHLFIRRKQSTDRRTDRRLYCYHLWNHSGVWYRRTDGCYHDGRYYTRTVRYF